MPRGRPRLGILYDQTAKYSPSNIEAIDCFRESAIHHGLHPMMLTKDDLNDLRECRGLLIRDTTHPANYTYEFALRAEQLKIPCIDSSIDIMRGSNKLWQNDCFKRYNIPHPETWTATSNNYIKVAKDITYPCIIKIPDSCFSQGVFKADTIDAFLATAKNILIHEHGGSNWHKSILIQEFMPTDFDWRVCIFKRKILFVVKYYMAKDDWKIIKYDRQGGYIDGRSEAISDLPLPIYYAATQCLTFLDNGLYGIDIKEVNGQPYIIEINDNPSIDHGVEDTIKEDHVYNTIIKAFL